MADEKTDESREDIVGRTRLTDIQRSYELWSMRTYKTLLAIVIIQVLLGAASIYLWTQITDARRDTVERACQQDNNRNATSSASLIKAAAADEAAAPTAAAKAEVRRRRDVTLALLDLVAPKTDCNTQADKLVKK